MHPGKLPLLIILLVTVTALALAVFGRDSKRLTALSVALVAVVCGGCSFLSGYLGVLALSRGWITLAKHGGKRMIYSISDSPLMFPVAVGGLLLLSVATGYAAVWLVRRRFHVGA